MTLSVDAHTATMGAALTEFLLKDRWLARVAVTFGLIAIVYLARQYQLSLLKQTEEELNVELYSRITAEESTNITEESLQSVNRPDLTATVAELDETEYAEAHRVCEATREFIQQKEAIESFLTQRPPLLRPSTGEVGKERKLAAEISDNFERLGGLWNKTKTATPEIKDLVKSISLQLSEIPVILENDRVAASQCMSICCTAILKYDGLYVLDAIRNNDDDIAGECQGIIERAVPFIWAT